MRVHWRDLAGLEVYGEHANVLVFEDDLVAVAGNFDDVLGRSGARGGVNRGGGEKRCPEDCSRNFHGVSCWVGMIVERVSCVQWRGVETPGVFVGASGKMRYG